jgi:hypothetical protein
MWCAPLTLALFALLQSEETRPFPKARESSESIFFGNWTPLEFVDRSGTYNLAPADLGIDTLGGRHVVFGARSPDDCPPQNYWCGLYHQFSSNGQNWTSPTLIPATPEGTR